MSSYENEKYFYSQNLKALSLLFLFSFWNPYTNYSIFKIRFRFFFSSLKNRGRNQLPEEARVRVRKYLEDDKDSRNTWRFAALPTARAIKPGDRVFFPPSLFVFFFRLH